MSAGLDCVREHLEAAGAGQLVAGFERRVLLRVGEPARPALAVAIQLAGGSVGLATAAGPVPAGALVVELDVDTALRVGRGEALVEEEYAAGRVRADGASADDLRLGPALELLLEALAGCGLVGAPGRGQGPPNGPRGR